MGEEEISDGSLHWPVLLNTLLLFDTFEEQKEKSKPPNGLCSAGNGFGFWSLEPRCDWDGKSFHLLKTTWSADGKFKGAFDIQNIARIAKQCKTMWFIEIIYWQAPINLRSLVTCPSWLASSHCSNFEFVVTTPKCFCIHIHRLNVQKCVLTGCIKYQPEILRWLVTSPPWLGSS